MNCVAAMLRSLGVGARRPRADLHADDPEAVFAMLACARIGAIHSVVFGGFAAASLATRIDDAKPDADGHRRRRHAQRQGDRRTSRSSTRRCALAQHPPAQVLIVNRGTRSAMPRGRRAAMSTTQTLRAQHDGARVPCEWLESNEPSYILYTSGTTGQPKGVQRDTGGYAVALASSMKRIFCGEPGETMFTTSDIGWVVGHSYIVYGPLIAGIDDDHVRRPADPARMPASGGRSSRSTRCGRCSPRRPRSAC